MKYILSFLLLINIVFAQRINIVKDTTALPANGNYENQVVTVSGIPFIWQRGGWYQVSTSAWPLADTIGTGVVSPNLTASGIGLSSVINAKQLVSTDTNYIKFLLNKILADTTG
jgi:hypothetical protein